MTEIGLHTPARKPFSFMLWLREKKAGIEEFFIERRKRQQSIETARIAMLSSDEKRAELLRELGCNYGGHCSHCQHIIRDVIGD